MPIDDSKKRKDVSRVAKPQSAKKQPAPGAFVNEQLSLFQTFLCNSDDERAKLSNTVDLWDSVPRYSVSRQTMFKLRTPEGFLENLEIPFRYRSFDYTAIIQPARIKDDDNISRHYYPSANEELVEDALRKLAADQTQGFFDKQKTITTSGVQFSLGALRAELKRRGHTRSFQEIVQSLKILAGSNIELRAQGQKVTGFAMSPYLPVLAGVTRDQLNDNPDSRWLAQFHPLVTQSIDQLTYRQFNYDEMMANSTQVARWLHKQISLKFTFAAIGRVFEMRYSTIKRDSALFGGYAQERDAIVAATAAFDELKKRGALLTVDVAKIRGLRNKIEDVIYTVTPSPAFVAQMKAANKRFSLAAEKTAAADFAKTERSKNLDQ